MTQNSDKNPSEVKPIQLPDEIWQEIEELDRKIQQKLNEAQERNLAKKTPPEREKIEKEIKKQKQARHAPETRTEEELTLEDERIIKLLDKMRKEDQ
jgi:hypothetical protein